MKLALQPMTLFSSNLLRNLQFKEIVMPLNARLYKSKVFDTERI